MKTCMIVDDSKTVRKFSKKIIEDLGFLPIEACDGKEALEECKKKIPDCILLDWNMPVMDGLEFLKEFKLLQDSSSAIVIFCTTVNEMSRIQEAIINGANEYIMKPYDLEVVKDKFIQTGLIQI